MRRKSRRVDITVDEGVWQEKLVGVDGRWLLDILGTDVVAGDDTGVAAAAGSRIAVADRTLDIVVADGAGVVVDNTVIVAGVVVVMAVVFVVDSIVVVVDDDVDSCLASFPHNLHTYVHTSTPTEQTHYIPTQHYPP